MTLSVANILILFTLYAFLLADVFAISFHKPFLRWVLGKTELMPILAFFYCYNAPVINPYILAALFFGWIGDLFLLKKDITACFLSGLVAFLIGHIFYIMTFAKISGYYETVPVFAWMILAVGFILLLLAYLIVLRYKKKMIVPGLIYYSVVIFLNFTIACCYHRFHNIAFTVAILGSLLFLVSDSLLALRSIAKKLPPHTPLIIFTYVPAQFLLIMGTLL